MSDLVKLQRALEKMIAEKGLLHPNVQNLRNQIEMLRQRILSSSPIHKPEKGWFHKEPSDDR